MPIERPTVFDVTDKTPLRLKAFDFLADATKQLITVATGIITLTVLFLKDLNPVSRWVLLVSWILFLISVLFGILVLLNISGQLASLGRWSMSPLTSTAEGNARRETLPDINDPSNRLLSLVQLATFFAGLVAVICFGLSVVHADHPNPDKQHLEIKVSCEPPATKVTEPSGDKQKSQGKADLQIKDGAKQLQDAAIAHQNHPPHSKGFH